MAAACELQPQRAPRRGALQRSEGLSNRWLVAGPAQCALEPTRATCRFWPPQILQLLPPSLWRKRPPLQVRPPSLAQPSRAAHGMRVPNPATHAVDYG